MAKNLGALPTIPNFVSDGAGKYQAIDSLTETQIINTAKALLNKSFCPGQAVNKSRHYPNVATAPLHEVTA